jgi:ubiquinone/menaquinone biosynthesis C-methylase UbiE
MVDISEHNRAVYADVQAIGRYGLVTDLQAPETFILTRVRSEFKDRRILDIGVGGGRTTPHLLEISKNYVGIDYSPQMIAQCRARYPSVSFEVCDAKDLSRFGAEAFGLVIFSFNGIDCNGHADRLTMLREIRRVLAKGGAFVFSSHNRDYTGVGSVWRAPDAGLRRFVKFVLTDPAAVLRHVLNKRHEEANDEYAIINDDADGYRCLLYYISMSKQVEQLKKMGFENVAAFGRDGRMIGERESADCHQDPWIYYLCR